MALFISILIPNVIGFLGGLIGGSFGGFKGMIQPSFTPPSAVFPIAWTIIFILMGVSAYLIYKEHNYDKEGAYIVYAIQLIVNALWNIFFFKLKWYLFSFIWIILLIILVVIMIYKFYKINKTSAYLQIPYLLWLIFASILTFNVYLLN